MQQLIGLKLLDLDNDEYEKIPHRYRTRVDADAAALELLCLSCDDEIGTVWRAIIDRVVNPGERENVCLVHEFPALRFFPPKERIVEYVCFGQVNELSLSFSFQISIHICSDQPSSSSPALSSLGLIIFSSFTFC